MTTPRHPGSLLQDLDLDADQLLGLVDSARQLKADKLAGTERPRLGGREIVLVFEKNSTRTRCAFEVAAYDQGAHATYLGPDGSHVGKEESLPDTARVLGRMYDGIGFRGFAQQTVEQLDQFAGVAVWNGLTDQWHPDPVAGRHPDDDRVPPRAGHRHRLLLHRRRPQQRGPLAAGHRRPAGHGRADRRAARAEPAAGCRQHRPGRGGAQRCPRHNHRRRRGRGARRRLRLHRRVGQHGRAAGGLGDPGARAAALPGDQRALDSTGRPGTRFMHCLPSVHNTQTELGARLHDQFGLDGAEVTEDVFESKRSVVFD